TRRENGAGAITLEELATHTAGLPRVPIDRGLLRSLILDPGDPYRLYTDADLDRFLASFERPEKRSYDYSNLGFALLGAALERATHTPLSALFHDRITVPLGMTSTFTDMPSELGERVAVGHDKNGCVASMWTPGVFAGAGALKSTARDLSLYLAALRSMKPPQLPTLVAVHAASDVPEESTGLAWVLDRRHGDDIVRHNGGTGGFDSFIGWSRASGLGVVVL